MYVGGHKISTLTGWILWRWPPSPAPAAGLCETVRSASCRCGPDSGAARPECGRLSACSPVSTTWAPSAPPSPAVPGPMGLQPATTVPQMWCRDPAALLPGRSAPPRPWGGENRREFGLLQPLTVHLTVCQWRRMARVFCGSRGALQNSKIISALQVCHRKSYKVRMKFERHGRLWSRDVFFSCPSKPKESSHHPPPNNY